MSEKNLIDVVVKRSQWLRGEGPSHSYLRRDTDGKMCCLGFACLAIGATPDDITSLRYPETVEGIQWPEQNMRDEDSTSSAMVRVNDSARADVTEAVRERMIAELGADLGFNFTFVD